MSSTPEARPQRSRRTLVLVTVMVIALIVYFALAAQRGVVLIGQGTPTTVLLGVAILVLPLIGLWILVSEVRFGAATSRLGLELSEQGIDAAEDLPTLPSGRYVREAADEAFERRRAEVEQAPEDWRAWYRLGVAYDMSGDRKRARSAMRKAISLR